MVSVIIPTLNEERSISKIVRFVKANPLVAEVIVVDDHSVDGTVEEAKKADARVIISTKIGKGASMRDGLLVSQNETIVFLDGDIENYTVDTINKMIAPILGGAADFVKATFKRQAGRVTELVARPLLSLLFPSLNHFQQPLSGVIAGKKDYFQKVNFEDDYGVDIGILIDMVLQNVRIQEVNIGEIENKMKPWHQLSSMSREVARAILKRAQAQPIVNLDCLETINIIGNQMEFAIKETLLGLKKMIVFDMDNTIFVGKFIEKAADRFGFRKELDETIAKQSEPYLRTKLIAKFFAGRNIAELLDVADKIALVEDVISVVEEVKKRGYIVGLITDSYDCIANHIKNKIGADFILANELEFSKSVATGEVKIPSFFICSDQSLCQHKLCKSNALLHIAQKYSINLSNIIAVGDSEYDTCMVKYAGIGIAFCSTDKALKAVADHRIETRSFSPILSFAD